MSKKITILSALLLLIVLIFGYLLYKKNSAPAETMPVLNQVQNNTQATNENNSQATMPSQASNNQVSPSTQTEPAAAQIKTNANATTTTPAVNNPAPIINTNSQSISLAQCLKDQGVKFYGAFWCSHCQNQKAMFGADAVNLPFIECATPDGQGQLAICKENNIGGYPTWVFPDGSRLSGELTLEQLSAKTGCSLTK